MDKEINASIQALENVLTLNGPKVMVDHTGETCNMWIWAQAVRSQVLTAVLLMPIGTDSEVTSKAIEETRLDLVKAVEYMTLGCPEKGQPHRFTANPEDPRHALYCLDCSRYKPVGISLPGIIDETGSKERRG